MNISLAANMPRIAELCEGHGVANPELFGSATGADFNTESSDFDFLVGLDDHASGSRARHGSALDWACRRA